MRVNVNTTPYNHRRYGKPWIARVAFPTPKGEYHFGAWVGRPGEDGVLTIEAAIGDVVAVGQRDMRQPHRSEHNFFIALDGGRLDPCTKKEAWMYWCKTSGGT